MLRNAAPLPWRSRRLAAILGATAVVQALRAEAQFSPSLNLLNLSTSNGFRISGEGAGDQSGCSVSSAGDFNGDGMADLILGAFGAGTSDAGAAFVLFGTTNPFPSDLSLATLNGVTGFKISGEGPNDFAGRSVAGLGDVNGDGTEDVLIGADGGNTLDGASYVVFGGTNPFPTNLNLANLDGTNGFQIDGEIGDGRAGYGVSAAGDVNGDGLADILIGAIFADANGLDSGASYVVFGSSNSYPPQLPLAALNGSNGFRISGGAAGDLLGSVANAGDINGDGLDDLAIGAIGQAQMARNRGPATLCLGLRTHLQPT